MIFQRDVAVLLLMFERDMTVVLLLLLLLSPLPVLVFEQDVLVVLRNVFERNSTVVVSTLISYIIIISSRSNLLISYLTLVPCHHLFYTMVVGY